MKGAAALDGEHIGPSGVPLLGRALLSGAVFALVEGVLVYSLGTAPPGDVVPLLLSSIAAFAGLGILLQLARSRPFSDAASDAILLITPVAVFAMRGWSATGPEYLLAVGRLAPLALLIAALVVIRRHGVSRSLTTRSFAVLSLVSQALAIATAALRVVDFEEFRNLALLDPARHSLGPALIGVLLAAVIVVPARRLPREGFLYLAPVGALVLIAVAQGSRLGMPFSALGPTGAVASQASPSVLLVVLDTVRADRLSLYGYARATSPNLERFAKRATVFERAYATSPYTLAAHASLFTGLLASDHGAHPIPYTVHRDRRSTGHWPLPAQGHATLAERLKQRGYATGAVVANYALLAEWTGLARGFQVYQCRAKRFYGYVPSLVSALAPLGWSQGLALRATWGADATLAAAREWFTQNLEPTVLFLNLMDAHDPYEPPRPFADRFLSPGADVRETKGARYDGEIAYIDSQLGALFDWLQARGLLDPMLVIVTSDHGELLGEEGRWGHGQVLAETTLRVPLLVKLPHQKSGLRLPGPASHLEILTFVERVIDRPRDESVIGVLHALGEEPEVLAEHWIAAEQRAKALPGEIALRAIYSGSWKLIQRLGGPDELYDLASDPEEAKNLLASDDPAAVATRARLLSGIADLGESLGRSRPVPSVDDLNLERLRSLGYLGTD